MRTYQNVNLALEVFNYQEIMIQCYLLEKIPS